MWNYQYKHGDRPLAGYTIERAAGRGGFGEVYFAVSDSGRQVALKVVQGYEQIELRGISQCMNLKSPHLITIFDVRHNDENRPFVIMEYVAGPSLRQLLDQSPAGLGTQKAAFFLREMGKGLSYLHENGIVHRDLKPANVFYENGYVKIGDYGLSKLISATQHSAQTVTVGTVHYMAPEIGAGKYDRGIDIYALGAVLYEMLVGMVPFNGASPSEVLLKHLSAEPDLTNIPEPFATVIRKAMAKDPNQRYQSVQEMVEAVFGAEHIRQSVSVFSPDELSVVAARVAAPVGGGGGSGGAGSPGSGGKKGSGEKRGDGWDRFGAWADGFGERMAEFGERMADVGLRAAGNPAGLSSHTMVVDPPEDPITRGQRRFLALIVVAAVGIVGGMMASNHSRSIGIVLPIMLTALGGAVGIRMAVRRFTPRLAQDPSHVHQLATGGMATIWAAMFSFPLWAAFYNGHGRTLGGTWLSIIVPLFCMKTAEWADPKREERVSFWDTAFLAGLFGVIMSSIFEGETAVVGLILVGISLATQLLSPWNAAMARKPEEKKKSWIPPIPAVPPIPPIPPIPAWTGVSPQWGGAAGGVALRYSFIPVPRLVRIFWLIGMLVCLALGITMLIAAGVENDSRYIPDMVCTGLGGMGISLVLLVQACRSKIYGWWRYLIKPVLIMVCMVVLLIAADALSGSRLNPDDQVIMIFVTVLSAMAMLAALFIPGPRRWPNTEAVAPAPTPAVKKPVNLRVSLRIPSLYSMLSRTFLIAAVVLTLGVAMNVPDAISVGLPSWSVTHELTTNYFVGYPAWPALLLRLGTVGAVVASVMGALALSLDRRDQGMFHVLCGVGGILLVVLGASLVAHAFHPSVWDRLSTLVNSPGQVKLAAVVADILDAFERGPLILAAATYCGGMILLNCCGRKLPSAPVEMNRAAA